MLPSAKSPTLRVGGAGVTVWLCILRREEGVQPFRSADDSAGKQRRTHFKEEGHLPVIVKEGVLVGRLSTQSWREDDSSGFQPPIRVCGYRVRCTSGHLAQITYPL
jgi:hypothetical protein